MGRENVTYIVAYLISSVVLGGYGLHNLNHFNRQSATSDYNCNWYELCQACCFNRHVPSFGAGLPSPHYWPRKDSITHPSAVGRHGYLQNTRTLNYPMLDKNRLAMRSRHMDEYRRILIASLRSSGHLPRHLSLNKTHVNQNNTRNSIDNFNIHPKTNPVTTDKNIENITNSRRKLSNIENTGPANSGLPLSETKVTPSIIPFAEHMYLENITKSTGFSSSTARHDTRLPELPLITTEDVQYIGSTSTSVPPTAEETMTTDKSLYKYIHPSKTSTNNFHYGGDVVNETLQSNSKTKTDFLFAKFRATLDQVDPLECDKNAKSEAVLTARAILIDSAFTKLTAISPEDRQENGISFLQSGFFLHQLLMSLTMDISQNVTAEIEECLGLNISVNDKIEILERTAAWLPKSNDVLKFRWSSRLILRHSLDVSREYRRGARAMQLQLSWLNGTETAADIAEALNKKVLEDSGGTMHDTFNEEEVAEGVCTVALSTLYVRATWRSAPTLLNDTMPFRDAPAAQQRTSRFFRLNDIMGYAYLHEWEAEAIEISYATPGLTLLMLVPKEPSLKPLVRRATSNRLDSVLGIMQTMRLAVTLPLYTLRMTLLLPNKLQDMGISSLLTNDTDCHSVKFSHAVQRLMFWAEAGRNAFKDDGIEWDPRPELEIVVDRPYLFFVRWQNITVMNGAFVL